MERRRRRVHHRPRLPGPRPGRRERFATIDPEEFYDFTVTRPQVRLTEDGERRHRLARHRAAGRRCPRVGPRPRAAAGVEPQLRWRTFSARRGLGGEGGAAPSWRSCSVALLADVPHTRPVRVSGTTDDRDLATRLGLAPPSLRGTDRYRRGPARRPAPERDPLGVVLGRGAPLRPPDALPQGGAGPRRAVSRPARRPGRPARPAGGGEEYERQVSEQVADDEDAAAYVAQLEDAEDTEAAGATSIRRAAAAASSGSIDELAAEVERFLRDHRGSSGAPVARLVAAAVWRARPEVIVALDDRFGEPVDAYVNGSQVWLREDGPAGWSSSGGCTRSPVTSGRPRTGTYEVFSATALALATGADAAGSPRPAVGRPGGVRRLRRRHRAAATAWRPRSPPSGSSPTPPGWSTTSRSRTQWERIGRAVSIVADLLAQLRPEPEPGPERPPGRRAVQLQAPARSGCPPGGAPNRTGPGRRRLDRRRDPRRRSGTRSWARLGQAAHEPVPHRGWKRRGSTRSSRRLALTTRVSRSCGGDPRRSGAGSRGPARRRRRTPPGRPRPPCGRRRPGRRSAPPSAGSAPGSAAPDRSR